MCPTPAAVRHGRHALVKPLAFVFRNDRLSADVRDFLGFARSREAQKILRVNGYLVGE